jgi:spore coat polysaccharide biosynthesis predicted glycosyltransferase SpsG
MTRAPAIVFRADASHTAGFGHVARLCAVIEEVAPIGAEPIAMFGGDDSVAAWIRNHDLPAHVRPPSRPWTPADVLAVVDQPGVRVVVVDGPALATELVPALAGRQIRTVVIDDRGDCPLSIDAVVNHNFHAPTLAAGYPGAQLRLLGRNYLMLRRAIRRYPRGSCHPRTAASLRVVVTFGGSDPVGATARTLRLVPQDRPSELVVITGPGFRDHDALRTAAAAATAAGHAVEIVRAPDDPARLFVSADAAICSAGGTLGELAYLGCPALGFAIVPDQVPAARAQADAGLITGGQPWASLDDDALRSQLQAFLDDDAARRDQRQRALATADEFGARRIVAEALS